MTAPQNVKNYTNTIIKSQIITLWLKDANHRYEPRRQQHRQEGR
jgi:hypothetical protein